MKRILSLLILFLMVFVTIAVSTSCSFEFSNSKEEIETEEEIVEESEAEPSTEKEIEIIIASESETEELEPEPSTEEDLSYLVTSTQYTLGYGVRERLTPEEDGTIFKVIYDIYSPVDVIEEGRPFYKCLDDNKIVYISWKYIGDEEDIEYVKAKREKEEKMKSSAYYEVFKNMTDEDYDLLARVLALEAGGEPWEGKLAVIEVIMNRMISKNPAWDNRSVSTILKQPGQFSTIKYLSHPYRVPTDNDYAAIEYVRENGATAIRKMLDEQGWTNINSLDYVYFATYKANGKDFVKYGDHYFGRETNSKYYHAPYKK